MFWTTSTTPGFRPLPADFNYRIDDWTVIPGANVEIRKDGTVIRRGVVEEVTPNGDILWLGGGEGGPRRLFERFEGFEVWAASEQTPLLYKVSRSCSR